ncbi:hypothetical protein CC2G_003902 [Coprinopsis cinerea AmutBmut pab1-1]|nr:hypothetical protein CC2G_003902 [Coprinopsis cinerea AmutBmut pab1-1]
MTPLPLTSKFRVLLITVLYLCVAVTSVNCSTNDAKTNVNDNDVNANANGREAAPYELQGQFREPLGFKEGSEEEGEPFDTMPFGFPKGSDGPGASIDPSDWASSLAYRYPQVPLEVEEYPVAPAPLTLEQVHVYVRHGERTPVGVRLAGPPANVPEHWNMCHTAQRFGSAVCDMLSMGSKDSGLGGEALSSAGEYKLLRLRQIESLLQPRKIVERKDGKAFEGECLLGELTDLGRHTTYNFGANLRRLYIDRLGFIPSTLANPSTVYFRTTNVPRTTESLQEIIRGLYPNDKCLPNAVPVIRVRNGRDENLIGNTYSCKRLEALQIGFAKAAADAFNPTLERLDSKLSKYINGNPIRIDGRPRASGILDTVRAAIAHGIKVPPEFEDKSIVDDIERAVVSEWFSGCKLPPYLILLPFPNLTTPSDKTEEVRRLGMGRLFDDMLTKMQNRISNKDTTPNTNPEGLKFLVHSTHDTAIAAICSTLDVFDDKWPAFTASVTFELFKDPGTASSASSGEVAEGNNGAQTPLLSRMKGSAKPKYYVRMRHQNKDMSLPICAKEGKHLPGRPEFCTLEAFKERVEQFVPKDWEAECSVSAGNATR